LIDGNLSAGKARAEIDDSTYSNPFSTFSENTIGGILEELAGNIVEASAAVAGSSTLATAGVFAANTYEFSLTLPPGKRIVKHWPVVTIGGIIYPSQAVIEPGTQGQDAAIHIYLGGDESPWAAGTAWKALLELADITVVDVTPSAGGGLALPVDVGGIDYLRGEILTFE